MTTPSADSPALGLWRLVSFRERRGDGLVDYFGPGAKGYISYMPTGHMWAMLTGAGRPSFKGPWAEIPDAAKGAALDGMVAYAGRFTDEGDRLIHHLEMCWIPNWEGRDLVRLASYRDGDGLTLRTVPDKTGRRPDQIVEWRKVR